MEVPLLSQDEFFRHLNLRSVHATSAKYHYRQALKERLRASSQLQSQSLPKIIKKQEKDDNIPDTKSPLLSPVKWLSPKTCKKLFGRPKIRTERRVLDFDNNLKVIKEEDPGVNAIGPNQKLLQSLLSNCHVLRHPGIRDEVQAKIHCGTTKNSPSFNIKDEFWEPPSTSILDQKCYWQPKQPCEPIVDDHVNNKKPKQKVPLDHENKINTRRHCNKKGNKQLMNNKQIQTVSDHENEINTRRHCSKKVNKQLMNNNTSKQIQLAPDPENSVKSLTTVMNHNALEIKHHVIHYRVQPGIKDQNLRTKNEQKMAAALALYHFYKPRSKDGSIISFKDFTKVFISQSNAHFLNLIVPMKKLSSHQLKKCHFQLQDISKQLNQNKVDHQYHPRHHHNHNNFTKKVNNATNNNITNNIKPIDTKITTNNGMTTVNSTENSNITTVKTSYGRVSKPVLAPIKTENVPCTKCQDTFNNVTNLKNHIKKVHCSAEDMDEQHEMVLKTCIIPSMQVTKQYKCDICYRRFDKRSRMIRHIKNVHSTEIHRVDLNKFVMKPKKYQRASWTLLGVS